MIDETLIDRALSGVPHLFDEIVPTATRPRAWSFYGEHWQWALAREWASGPVMTFVMLNPSVATPYLRDTTDKRCEGFARREQCAGMILVNLFAYRATQPSALLTAAELGRDIVGRGNLQVIRAAAALSTTVVLAWGSGAAHPRLIGQARIVRGMLDESHVPTYRLGSKTGAGQPRHPCRLASDIRLVPYSTRRSEQ